MDRRTRAGKQYHKTMHDYAIARQKESALRLRLLIQMVYKDDHRGGPLARVADFLDGTLSSLDLPPETQFTLNLIVDLILNDAPNARPTPHIPNDTKT